MERESCVVVCCVHRFKSWFVAAMTGMEKRLVRLSEPSKLTFVGELRGGSQFYAKMVSAGLIASAGKLYTSMEVLINNDMHRQV